MSTTTKTYAVGQRFSGTLFVERNGTKFYGASVIAKVLETTGTRVRVVCGSDNHSGSWYNVQGTSLVKKGWVLQPK